MTMGVLEMLFLFFRRRFRRRCTAGLGLGTGRRGVITEDVSTTGL